MGFSRQEHWSVRPLPSPGDLPDSGIELRSPALQANSLPSEPPGKHCLSSVLQRKIQKCSKVELYKMPWNRKQKGDVFYFSTLQWGYSEPVFSHILFHLKTFPSSWPLFCFTSFHLILPSRCLLGALFSTLLLDSTHVTVFQVISLGPYLVPGARHHAYKY